jgi:hypothetical protein
MARPENQSTITGGNRALWAVIGLLATVLLTVGSFIGRQVQANSISIAASEERVVNVVDRIKELGNEIDNRFAEVRADLKEQTAMITKIVRSMPK